MDLVDYINRLNAPVTIADPNEQDCPLIACNDPFLRLTGYQREDFIGRNCRFLQSPDNDPANLTRIRAAVAAREPVEALLLNQTASDRAFHNLIVISPLYDKGRERELMVGFQKEVPADLARQIADGAHPFRAGSSDARSSSPLLTAHRQWATATKSVLATFLAAQRQRMSR